MVHLTVSLMVMAVLIRSLAGAMGSLPTAAAPVLSLQPTGAVTGYDRIALSATANQMRALCCRMIRRAGYEGDAFVSLRADGSPESVILYLGEGGQQAIGEEQLTHAVGELLEAVGQVRWQRLGEGER